jgi:hypothetical protein
MTQYGALHRIIMMTVSDIFLIALLIVMLGMICLLMTVDGAMHVFSQNGSNGGVT